MKDIVLSGSLEMSDMTNTCGFVSVVMAGGHCWALINLVASPASSRLTWRGSIFTMLMESSQNENSDTLSFWRVGGRSSYSGRVNCREGSQCLPRFTAAVDT